MQRDYDRSLMAGWQGERFARTGKTLKGLSHYLEESAEPDPDQGAAELRGMFARMKHRQENRDGAG